MGQLGSDAPSLSTAAGYDASCARLAARDAVISTLSATRDQWIMRRNRLALTWPRHGAVHSPLERHRPLAWLEADHPVVLIAVEQLVQAVAQLVDLLDHRQHRAVGAGRIDRRQAFVFRERL